MQSAKQLFYYCVAILQTLIAQQCNWTWVLCGSSYQYNHPVIHPCFGKL